ncbi:hypothetical protein ALP64_200430 [Pseudomonas syringae pv. actinidiae]|nr:hypothetical protein ALP64_200430 [Pseudomonas syringae pv. actinidiae]
MICEARSIRVVLLNTQIRFVIQKPVKHIGRIAHANVDHLQVIRGVLVRNVGVKSSSRAAAVFGIDVARTFGFAASSEILSI